MKNTKIILVDNQSLFRKAFKDILMSIGNVEIIAEASDGKEFLALLESHQPDVVFMEINIPLINGIESTRLALKKYPDLKIIAFSANERQCYIEQMIEAGAKGYLSKCRNNYEILSEIIENQKDVNSYVYHNNSM